MGPTIIARNYAETLLALAQRHGGDAQVDEFARALDELDELLRREPRVQEFLATPRVDAEQKKAVLRRALEGRVPDLFLRFVLVVVEKRRQTLFPQITAEYQALVDEARGRLRAEITVAREPGDDLRREIVASLEKRYGREIAPSFRVEPALIGGAVIQVGDRVLDGSVRRRISNLRRRLMDSRLPRATAS